MRNSVIVLLLLALAVAGQSLEKKRPLLTVDKLKRDIITFVSGLWKTIKKEPPSGMYLIQRFIDFEKDNFEGFEQIAVNDSLVVLETLEVWRTVEKPLHKINVMYNTLKRFQAQQTALNRVPSPQEAWVGFTNSILEERHGPSIPAALDNLEQYFVTGKLFDSVIKDLDASSICIAQQSPHQLLYNLYNTVSMTEMKGYAMIQFSYMLLKIYGKGNFGREAEIETEKFINRTTASAAKMQEAMKRASRHLWMCDPKAHEEGKTYLEITQLLQGYLQNEVDLNSDGTCRENCAAYQYTKSHSCFQNLYCRQQRRCQGKILNCRFIDSDMSVCPSNVTAKRRYEYIEYENGKILGKKGPSCPKGKVTVESWWRWLFWHCSYCMCLCDEEGIFSDRYISMKSSLADIKNNKVVTGLRFTKKNRIIHLQVQEGLLLPEGVINKSTVKWAPVDEFRLNDRNAHKDQTYFVLSWHNRAIDLDVLEGREGHVLTGVRFQKIGSHLNFQIYVTPFDYDTGKLHPQLSEWLDNVNTEFTPGAKRVRIDISDHDVPTRSTVQSQIRSTHNEFLEFTHTSFDRDAAQTTVPFLDAQSVLSRMTPSNGAGIYYKNAGGKAGGFVGLKLVTFDYSNHLLRKGDIPVSTESTVDAQ